MKRTFLACPMVSQGKRETESERERRKEGRKEDGKEGRTERERKRMSV